MSEKITSTALARNLGDCLAKVKYLNADFLITKNHEVVAELRPADDAYGGKWGEVAKALSDYPVQPDFAKDLEKVNRLDSIPENPWG